MSPGTHLVADELRPNYERFLQKNFLAKARELGWLPRPGETDDVRLLRPALVAAMATVEGDMALGNQARELAEKWLQDRKAVSPDVAGAVLRSAGYYGDAPLFRRFLTEFEKTQDRQEHRNLGIAMNSFRDPAALEVGMQAVLSKEFAHYPGCHRRTGQTVSLAPRRGDGQRFRRQ